jgi:type VI secretion system secreted protein VgrG
MYHQTPLAEQRYLKTRVSGIEADLFAVEFRAKEALNKPFELTLKLIAAANRVNDEALLGQRIDISIGQGRRSVRHFNGLIHSVEQATLNDRQYQAFNLKVVPWFYYLGLGCDCRIFQNQSVLEIFNSICRQYYCVDYELNSLEAHYAPLAYCTQFNESDGDFIERLLQQAGISYYFNHSQGKHTMVLFDRSSSQPTCSEQVMYAPQSKGSFALTGWERHAQWHSTRVSVRDYHAPQVLEASSVSQRRFNLYGVEQFEHYTYPGRFSTRVQAQAYTDQMIAYQDSHSHFVKGSGHVLSFLVGTHFELSQHPQSKLEGKYFLTELEHQAHDYTGLPFAHQTPADKAGQYYHNTFTCLSSSAPYAPPPPEYWPQIDGVQSATVVAIEERTAYAQHCVQVKVQFHWDRIGRYRPSSSCWISVGQGYAGADHGMDFIPREGSEVMVDFVGGNPDRPRISGMLPNARNKPAFNPDERPNVSGIKTRSSGSYDPGQGHELSFDDSRGNEQLTLHAHNALNLSSKGDENTTVGANCTHTVQGDHTISSHDSLLISAQERITLSAGENTITLLPTAIHINAPYMLARAGATATSLAAMVPTYQPPDGAVVNKPEAQPQQPSPDRPQKLALLKDMPDSHEDLSVMVNQTHQQSLAEGTVSDYILDPDTQTTGALSLLCDGTAYKLCDVQQLQFNQDQIAPIYLGKRVKKASSAKAFEQQQDNAYSHQQDNLFMVKTMSNSLALLNDGAYELGDIVDSATNWLAEQLGHPAKKEAVNTAIEAGALAAKNGKFLRDFIHGGKFYVKTVKGVKYIIFKGSPGARKYLKGVRYRADNPQLKLLNLVAKPGETDPSGFMKRLTGKAVEIGKDSRLGFMLIGGEDILQYYAKPQNKRHFSDLVAALGLDTGNYVVSSIIAEVGLGTLIVAFAPVEVAVFSAVVVAFLGLVIAGTINWVFDEIEDELGIRKEVHELTSECERFLKDYWPETLADLSKVESAPMAGDAF